MRNAIWVVEYRFSNDQLWWANPAFTFDSQEGAEVAAKDRAAKHPDTHYRATRYVPAEPK